MEQNENPYASPLTANAAIEPPRYLSGSFAFLATDLCLSLMFVFLVIIAMFFDRGSVTDWAVAFAFFILPWGLGVLAFIGLIREQKAALSLARIAGGLGMFSSLAGFLVMLWQGGPDPAGLILLSVKAAWNSVYIIAARSFAKK